MTEGERTFFMVWSEKSHQTHYRHETSGAASTEAERLARSHPGIKFYVFAAIGVAEVAPPPSVYRDIKFDFDDLIPF